MTLSSNNKKFEYSIELLKPFRDNLPKILENPIVKEFFSKEENMNLLNEVLKDLDTRKLEKLDSKFKEFYRLNRTIRYLTGLIKRYPIDYDKRVKIKNQRYQLVIDKPISKGGDYSNITLKDLLTSNELSIYNYLVISEAKKQNFFVIENSLLYRVIKELTPKQHKILYLYYEEGYNNKEIAKIFGQTEQNISYWHKKTLKQIKENMSEKEVFTNDTY